MAASSESLNPSPLEPSHPTNGHDSTEPPHHPAPDESKPSNAQSQSTDGVEPGEKRKRADPTDDDVEQALHPLWKTSLCSYFRRSNGACSHGDTCRYAHGEAELRPRPDSSWDPTSEQAKKLLKAENGEKSRPIEVKAEVLMTDALDGDSSDPDLSKCLLNLPMKWSADKLRNFLSEQGIVYKSAKKKKGMTVGFVNFESAEQVKRAIEELDGRSVGNKNLKVADVVPRSFEKKTKLAVPAPQSSQNTIKPPPICDNNEVSASTNVCEDGDTMDDDLTPVCSASKARSARDVVTPLAYMPYIDQLESKKNNLMQTLKRLTKNARKACPNGVSLPEWILKSREIGGLPCKFEGILESPLVNGYRNKCEFSIGYSIQGKPTVGFMLGNFREGVTAVEEPTNCPNISRIACKYAAFFQDFLQHSDLPIWNRLNNTGFWRQLTVREGRTPGKVAEGGNYEVNISEVMLIVQVCTVGFDDGLVNSEFEKMAQAFSVGASADSPLPLTALLVQDHKGISNAAPADAPLRSIPISKAESHSGHETGTDGAEARINDYIDNLRFCISPTAFFQVNALAAEKLYSLAGDWAGLGPDTLLFDICCGTGTIGLTLAHRVGMVVGIEMNASAVSDAVRNAEINDVKNCRFVCAKAEDVMGSLLKEYLNLIQKQDEIANSSESNNEEPTNTEAKGTSDNIPDSEDSKCLELENSKGTSGCLDDSSKGLDNQPQNSCTSESGTTSVQPFKNVVAIVDPPRVGLHPIVIKALRTHPHLRRLVYISCNPESLVANAIELCTPSANKTEKGNKNNRGWRNMSSAGLARHRAKSMPPSEPFRPIKAMAVDLFPHTPHCELVMLLERLQEYFKAKFGHYVSLNPS
ncbi:Zinc finger CCCH domain-containing protein [Actinidia chinensis var. chinensis]|uniref:Zinc finger CCCH domain-containing protein n=1 Tax=Actinidia chinensis var. chinensis TaxID=1590841 RepID=A0A2R6P7M1_ACTCC|nr:Zinc finger CCCH domain-containing protein [Actinidia chinensis var. chinensis]